MTTYDQWKCTPPDDTTASDVDEDELRELESLAEYEAADPDRRRDDELALLERLLSIQIAAHGEWRRDLKK